MARLNPFPDYPVTRLREEPGKIQETTIITPAIERSRELVEKFIGEWYAKKDDPSQNVQAALVSVKGDYGTGKTHLLLDAVGYAEKLLSRDASDVTVLRVSCLETDPVTWFRSAIGPELKRPFLAETLIRLYAKAGQSVASEAKLTQAAVEKLQVQPGAIHELITKNLLSVTGVDSQFQKHLTELCRDVNEETRNALMGLIWAETADLATRWLAGEQLERAELGKLRISRNFETDVDANGVLISLAAIHSDLELPFIILIDELEHLTQYDTVNHSKRNITWFKRLLEELANYQVLVFIAGHWSAWETQSDYLARLSQQEKPIELIKLTGSDVMNIISARVAHLSFNQFDLLQAETIAELGKGNIRRILSLCHALFRESDGFKRPLSIEEIRNLAERIGQRISIADAILRVHEILENERIDVRRDANLGRGSSFDLIGYKAGHPRIVVEFKHAITQQDHYSYARHFRDRIKHVIAEFPNILGCFVTDGNIDDELLSILQTDVASTILWFDLNQQDAISKLASDLHTALGSDRQGSSESARFQELVAQNEKLIEELKMAKSGDNEDTIKELQAQRIDLEKQLADLQDEMNSRNMVLERQLDAYEQKRSEELKALYARLQEFGATPKSKRDKGVVAPTKEESDTKIHLTYTELTRQPSLSAKIRAGGTQILTSTLLILFGSVLVFTFALSPKFYIAPFYELTSFLFIATGFVTAIIGAAALWQKLSQVESFFEYSVRIMREIYLNSANPQDLIRVDNILRTSLGTYGPRYGKRAADQRLAQTFPKIFDYLAENDPIKDRRLE